MLKFKVENLDEVEEQYRSLYKEMKQGDKTVYLLQVDGAVANERLRQVQTEKDNFRKNNVRLTEVLRAFAASNEIELTDDMGPEEVATVLKQKAEEAAAAAAATDKDGKKLSKAEIEEAVQERLKAIKANFEATHAANMTKLKDTLSRTESERAKLFEDLENRTIEQEVVTEARKRGLKPGAEKFLVGQAREVFRYIEGKVLAREKNDPEAVIYGPDGVQELTIKDFVDNLAGKDATFLFESNSGAGGAGGSGGAGHKSHHGPNPWRKETRNLTRQMELLKSDPALAKRLQAEAGVRA